MEQQLDIFLKRDLERDEFGGQPYETSMLLTITVVD